MIKVTFLYRCVNLLNPHPQSKQRVRPPPKRGVQLYNGVAVIFRSMKYNIL